MRWGEVRTGCSHHAVHLCCTAQAEAADEPLAVRQVVMRAAAKEALTRAWRTRKARSMYGSAEQYLELVQQVRTTRPAARDPTPWEGERPRLSAMSATIQLAI